MTKHGMCPVHPGEVLLEEFMKLAEPPINANTLAKALDVPPNRITAILKGQRNITRVNNEIEQRRTRSSQLDDRAVSSRVADALGEPEAMWNVPARASLKG